MNNPEKLATSGTQDDKTKKNITKTQHNVRKLPHITQIRHKPSYEQLEVKTNKTSFLSGNRKGHHNTVLRT